MQMTPQEIVQELDRYIVGQHAAKRSVAVAMRNRWRRQQVPLPLRDEITPKNIIMIGATGIGKTEIARRLAKLAGAPFLKVEATKFTEVGYVGKDVESMVRDLVDLSMNLVRAEELKEVEKRAHEVVEERLLDLLYPSRTGEERPTEDRTREKLRTLLREGSLDDRVVEIAVTEKPALHSFEVFSQQGLEEISMNLKDMLGNMMPKSPKARRMPLAEAREVLLQEESQKLIDVDVVRKKAIERAEQSGIIFLDEIDKVTGSGSTAGPQVSREGVQRDLLPIVEGTTVTTKHGVVKTDHILFIAAGAFHLAKPSDLLPELQGRFPIRVELDPLTEADLYRILTEPENSLPRQYRALLATEGIEIEFEEKALRKIAELAARVNEETENIGARRLQTVMEKLLEDISFRATEARGEIRIDAGFVEEKLLPLLKNRDLTKYIL